jgi:hypothetical protein
MDVSEHDWPERIKLIGWDDGTLQGAYPASSVSGRPDCELVEYVRADTIRGAVDRFRCAECGTLGDDDDGAAFPCSCAAPVERVRVMPESPPTRGAVSGDAIDRLAREIANDRGVDLDYETTLRETYRKKAERYASILRRVANRDELVSKMAKHLDDEILKAKHIEDWEPERVAEELLDMALGN